MEKLPTIILPGAEVPSSSPRAASSLGSLEKLQTSIRNSPLRLGGIRLRCPRPQQLVDEFYVKRLGMQELALSSLGNKAGCGGALGFSFVLPPRSQLHQVLQQLSLRSQHRRSSSSSSRADIASSLADEVGGSGKLSLKENEVNPSGVSSRRTSFGSQYSSRNVGNFPALSGSRFAAFEFFSPAEIDSMLAEASESADNHPSLSIKPKNWLRHPGGQFVLEFVPVQKVGGMYKPFENHACDAFTHLAFSVCDVDAVAVDLSQHMVRVQPAGQFLDMAYAASFTDPQNFTGRLLQYMSEYKMASLKALLSGESRHSSSPEPPPDDPEERRKLNQGPPDTSVGSKDEADTTHPYPFPSPQSSCCSLSVPGSVASSFFSNERDGCLPAPTPEEVKAVELSDSSSPSFRFDTLPLQKLPVLHHIEISVADVKKTLAFYENVLGMTLIDKKTAHGFGFTLYFLSLEAPTNTSLHYWLWTQRFSTICIKVHTDGTPVKDYEDLQPHECGFLGISFLCAESEGANLLKRIKSYNIGVDTVDDEVYGQQVLLLRDPQNIPIRIALTN
ncbi:glyoxalase, putative [Eimeria necatrix]|uniref:Glyoxalase, putative n=1 Tax=Eimeria necatrix TaxID=51315 RepID=U6MX34_9EIME|nr:glyoxalase, putative [Eimeria necatrix]CDJ67563.1 glyoxalase, putative [Eimeria necatrix]